jgi:hypothetical protein
MAFVINRKVGDFSKRVFFFQNVYCALNRTTPSLQSSFSPIPGALDIYKDPVKTVLNFPRITQRPAMSSVVF